MEKFTRREWVAGDRAPGAADLNRIESGIVLAHNRIDEITGEAIKPVLEAAGSFDLGSIEKLEEGAKVADCAAKINEIIDALSGKAEE